MRSIHGAFYIYMCALAYLHSSPNMDIQFSTNIHSFVSPLHLLYLADSLISVLFSVRFPTSSQPLSDRVFIRKASAFMSCITCSGRQVKDFCREILTYLRLQIVSIIQRLKYGCTQYRRQIQKQVYASRMTKCNNRVTLKFTRILCKCSP